MNPSDRGRLTGRYAPFPLPGVAGLEGVGTVVEASGADIQDWVGKRVSFLQEDSGYHNYLQNRIYSFFHILFP